MTPERFQKGNCDDAFLPAQNLEHNGKPDIRHGQSFSPGREQLDGVHHDRREGRLLARSAGRPSSCETGAEEKREEGLPEPGKKYTTNDVRLLQSRPWEWDIVATEEELARRLIECDSWPVMVPARG
ncbi:hypothetical protein E4U47_003798 [Claviceps purpurea]|nr:hypothetical protein E4U47_003798 [Claviceps purpurea]